MVSNVSFYYFRGTIMLQEVHNKEEDIFQIAREAGNEILDVYQGDDFQVEIKSDKTPLTIADKKSNHIIVKGLQEIFPEIPILSEESRRIPYHERKKWKYLWIIDPLDGTKEFIKRNGEFSINLALIKNSVPIFGILYIPVKEILYFASKGYGAYKKDRRTDNIKLPTNRKDKKNEKSNDMVKRIIFSRSHYTEETKHFVERIKKQFSRIHMISAGSAMKMAYLAEGKADIYPRLAPTMEWDIAAGQIILEESGGKLLDFYKRTPLIYNKKDLINPWFLAIGNNVNHTQFI